MHRIAIDFFYNMNGYCLFLNDNKNIKKFVGTVQMFDNFKYHKFVHSFLNIAAFCRATSFNDINNREQKIKILTSNMYGLCTFYEDSNNGDWIKLLPLWIAALFEFYVTDEVSEIVRAEFNKICLYKKQRQEVYIFLSGFWVDMTRNMPNDNNFINKFMSEISCENNT